MPWAARETYTPGAWSTITTTRPPPSSRQACREYRQWLLRQLLHLLASRRTVAPHHFPVEVARVSVDNPVELAQPIATAPVAPGQLASERLAFGAAIGVNEPFTFAFLTTILAFVAAPVTTKFGV